MDLFSNRMYNEIGIGNDNYHYLTIRKTRHYYLTSGFLVNLSENVKLKPSVMIKEDFKGPTSFDFNTFLLLSDRLWIGGSYRTAMKVWKKSHLQSDLEQKNAASAMLEFFVTPRLRVGYSYDFTTSGLADYQSGTHEISIGMLFPNRKQKERVTGPRYF